MPRCEDYPCCGHGDGECPNEDGTYNCSRCGRRLLDLNSSLCSNCLSKMYDAMEDPTGQDLDYFLGDY